MEDKGPEGTGDTSNHASDIEVHGTFIQAGQVTVQVPGAPGRDPVPEVPVTVTWRWLTHDGVLVGEGDEQDSLLANSPVLEILVEGRSAQAAILRDLRPVVLSRRPPRQVRVSSVADGILQVRPFEGDLDRDDPELRPLEADFPFKVSLDDPEQLRVRWTSTRDEVRWRVDLHWVCAGRAGTVRIPEEGSFGLYPSRRLPPVGAVAGPEVDTALGDPTAGRILAEELGRLLAASGQSVAETVALGRRSSPPADFTGRTLRSWSEGRSVPFDQDLFRRLVELLEACAARRDPRYRGRSTGGWEEMRRAAVAEEGRPGRSVVRRLSAPFTRRGAPRR
ncbi:hypothetical protein [Kitasatospora sp. NPDC059327]|uniref:hypothetical protein n=1 Tax=Kitasatospora sp. NPDC059327 TaxID=3346803 RepID=UPI00368911B2